MFIKTTKAKEYEYIKLVGSYREEGKTKHRVLYNFGRVYGYLAYLKLWKQLSIETTLEECQGTAPKGKIKSQDI